MRKQVFLSLFILLSGYWQISCNNYIGNPYRHALAPRVVPALENGMRVEPGNWWTGMKHNQVELLVQYPGLSDYTLKLGKSSGIKVVSVQKGDSPNYLFVTLMIGPKAPAQHVPLIFSKGSQSVTYDFPVLARNSGAKAQGVDSRDVVYLLFPDRFANGDPGNDQVPGMYEGTIRDSLWARHGGDLKGIADHLDYLQELGVSTIWLNPELENNQLRTSYHGYAVTDHYRIDRRMGTNEQYRDLVKQIHGRGMKVVRDVVLNHIGNKHYWMEDLPTKDWVNQWPEFTRTNYRAPAMLDPYASEYDSKLFSDGWFDTTMPDLNQRNPHLANYLIQQAIWWVEYAGIDGLRIDTYTYSDLNFMSRYCGEIRAEYPNIGMFGEIWEHSVIIQGYFADDQPMKRGGYDSNLPGVIDFQVMFALQEALTREQGWTEGISRLYYIMAQDYFYKDPMKNVVMLDNHDFTRFFTTVGENFNKYKSGVAFLMTTRGIPQLYYGTEILASGSTSPTDALVRKDFPGGWPGDPANKFTAAGRTERENEAFNFVKKLIAYRKQTPALQNGKLTQFVPFDGVYAYFRYDDQKTVMVVLNTANQDRKFDTKRFQERMKGFSRAKNVVTDAVVTDLSTLQVPANSPLILELMR